MQPSVIGLALCFVVIVGGGLAACTQAEAGIQQRGITVGEPVERGDYEIVAVKNQTMNCMMVTRVKNVGSSTSAAISCVPR